MPVNNKMLINEKMLPQLVEISSFQSQSKQVVLNILVVTPGLKCQLKTLRMRMTALSRGKKCELLNNHFSLPAYDTFPRRYENGCSRSFRYEYFKNRKKKFKNRPRLKYSPHLDSTFCVPCALLVNNRSNRQSLVTKPFRK